MNKSLPNITDAEWKVMETIWDGSPITSTQILDRLQPTTEWSSTTIYTLLSRLEKKGAIKSKDKSSPKVYYPLVSKSEYREKETETFLDKLYDGSLKLFLTSFVGKNKLSSEELEELKEILDESAKE